jgi:hypothetical protein
MLMTGYAFNKKGKKNSGAERIGVSGPGPECPENPDSPGKSPDSPGFNTAVEKTDITQFFNLA